MSISYRYVIRFPDAADSERQAWPNAIRGRLFDLADVVDVTVAEEVSAWTRGRNTDVRIEWARQRLELVTVSADAAGAEAARVAILNAVDALRQQLGAGVVAMVRDTVDVYAIPAGAMLGPTRSAL